MSGVGWMWGCLPNFCSSAASASGCVSVRSTMNTASNSGLRASKLRLKTCSVAMSAAAMPSALAANLRRAASGWGGGRRSSSVSAGASTARRSCTGRADRGSLSSETRIMVTGLWLSSRDPNYPSLVHQHPAHGQGCALVHALTGAVPHEHGVGRTPHAAGVRRNRHPANPMLIPRLGQLIPCVSLSGVRRRRPWPGAGNPAACRPVSW